MIRLDIDEEVIEKLLDFCGCTSCGYCPFGESGYHIGTECKLKRPYLWDYEVEDE